eukprot:m.19716 g.19716  ORF g.19716 m.19716 type:complete len:122 (+) comp10946_c0_seq1:151-516(+)
MLFISAAVVFGVYVGVAAVVKRGSKRERRQQQLAREQALALQSQQPSTGHQQPPRQAIFVEEDGHLPEYEEVDNRTLSIYNTHSVVKSSPQTQATSLEVSYAAEELPAYATAVLAHEAAAV